MLVAVLIGSMRTLAQITSDPAAILAEMNTRLQGRTNGGFSTCLAFHLHADGAGTLASAGHPGPYLNGREMELPGGLPLGIAPHQHYETCTLRLEPGGRMAFYSDGVFEGAECTRRVAGIRAGKRAFHAERERDCRRRQRVRQGKTTSPLWVIERSAELASVA